MRTLKRSWITPYFLQNPIGEIPIEISGYIPRGVPVEFPGKKTYEISSKNFRRNLKKP